METNFKIILVAIAIAFTAVSCGKGSSVDAALSQIENALAKLEKNKTSMTEADWQAFSDELEKPAQILSQALESNQVGTMKKLQISAAMMRYAVVIGEAAMHTLADSLKVHSEEIHGLVEAVSENSEELQEVIDGVDLQQAMQELQKAAEKLQKKN